MRIGTAYEKYRHNQQTYRGNDRQQSDPILSLTEPAGIPYVEHKVEEQAQAWDQDVEHRDMGLIHPE